MDQNTFGLVKERADLRYDQLYYLYFREKPDKTLAYSPEEEVKKVSF
jgi:hypothetical protein